MQSFSISEALSLVFRMFVRNFWLLLGLSIVGALVQFGAAAISKMIVERSGLSICQRLETANKPAETAMSTAESLATTAYNKVIDIFKDLSNCFSAKNIALSMLVLFIHLLAAIFGFLLLMGWNRIALDLYDRGTSEFNRIFVTFLYSFHTLLD